MKHALLTFFLLPAALALAPPTAGVAADRQVLEQIVARVSDEIITRSELERQREELRRELSQQYSSAELEEIYHDRELHLLRDLIDQLLLVQRGREMGLSVEAELIKRLDAMRAEMGLKSLEELEQAVTRQGLSWDEFRQRLRNNLLTNQVIQRLVQGRVRVSQDELVAYYEAHTEEMRRPESYRLRELLISTENRSEEEARARAQEVLDKIRRGEKFEDLAKQYSDAPTASRGGELGEFEVGRLAPELEAAVSKLLEGGVSDVLETRHGYLLLQRVEYLPAGIPPFEKVEEQMRERLYMQKVQPALREVLSELRENAFVELKPGYVDTGAVKQRQPSSRQRGRRWRTVRRRRG